MRFTKTFAVVVTVKINPEIRGDRRPPSCRCRIAANIAKLLELLLQQADEYRVKADYCREMAAQATAPVEKEEWLQQATNWQRLASLSECRAAEISDPNHKNQMEILGELWEALASRLSKGND